MSAMTIPTSVRLGFRKLQTLTDEQASNLLAALQACKPSITVPDLAEAVHHSVAELPKGDIEDVIGSLVSFYSYRRVHKMAVDEVVDDILTSDDLKLSDDERNSVRERLTTFISDIRVIKIISKSLDVMFAREHVLTRARILTDIRPVFEDDEAETPIATTVIHTLHVRYQDGGRGVIKDMFFALDFGDIKALKTALDRAEGKAAGLRDLLQEVPVEHLEVQSE